MTDAVCESVYGSLRRSLIHTSTFSENGLAMRAALATLDVFSNVPFRIAP
jgi:ornithine--oxo-acid transaminase